MTRKGLTIAHIASFNELAWVLVLGAAFAVLVAGNSRSSAEQESNSLAKELSALRSESQSALAKLKERLGGLEKQLADEVANHKNTKEHADTLDSALKQARKDVESAQQVLKDIQDELNAKVAAALTLAAKQEAAQAELRKSAEEAKRQADDVLAAIRLLKAELTSATKRLAAEEKSCRVAKEEAAALAQELDAAVFLLDIYECERWDLEVAERVLRKELLGLRGKMKHVVFAIDCSGSMDENNRWAEVCRVIATWLEYLPVEECALVTFSDQAECFPANHQMVPMRVGNGKAQLVNHLNDLKPRGNTNTHAALSEVLQYAEVDTVILFTDGNPNRGRGSDSIYKLCRDEFEPRGIVINTVGLGEYLNGEFGEFLRKLPEIGKGTFIGK